MISESGSVSTVTFSQISEYVDHEWALTNSTSTVKQCCNPQSYVHDVTFSPKTDSIALNDFPLLLQCWNKQMKNESDSYSKHVVKVYEYTIDNSSKCLTLITMIPQTCLSTKPHKDPESKFSVQLSQDVFLFFVIHLQSRLGREASPHHKSLHKKATGVKTWQHTFRSTKSGQVVNGGTFQRHLRWPTQHTKESTSRRMFLTCNSLRNAFCPLSPFPVPPGGIFSSTIEASGVADSTAVSPWYAHTHKANSLFHKDTAGAVQLRYQCEPPSRLQSINDQTPVCVCETRTVSFRSA